MANPDSDLVLAAVAAGGATGLELLWVAPTGTTGPSDAVTALSTVSTSWEGMGYISSDGLTITPDESSNEIQAFGQGTPIRIVNTKAAETFQVVCLETNETVMDVYNRLELGTTTADASGDFSVSRGAVPVQRYSFIVDIVDGVNHIRFYYPSGEVKERTERKIGNGESIQYGFTIQAYPDSTGKFAYEYYRVPALASS